MKFDQWINSNMYKNYDILNNECEDIKLQKEIDKWSEKKIVTVWQASSGFKPGPWVVAPNTAGAQGITASDLASRAPSAKVKGTEYQ